MSVEFGNPAYGVVGQDWQIDDSRNIFKDYGLYHVGSSVPQDPGSGNWTQRDAQSTLASADSVFQTTTKRANWLSAGTVMQMFSFSCGNQTALTLYWKGYQTLVWGWTGYRNFYIWNQSTTNWDILFSFSTFNQLYTETLTSTQISNGLLFGNLYFAALVNGWTANKTTTLNSDYIKLSLIGTIEFGNPAYGDPSYP